ncbi:hypothetical protein [Vibrio furnissii]
MISLTICAVLSGQDDWKAIHLYGTRWLDFLKRFVVLVMVFPLQ